MGTKDTIFFTSCPPDSRALCVSSGTELELRDQDKRPRRETWLAELSDPSEGVGRSLLRFLGSVWGQMVRVCWRSPGEHLEVVSVDWSWCVQCVEHAVRGQGSACALPQWELLGKLSHRSGCQRPVSLSGWCPLLGEGISTADVILIPEFSSLYMHDSQHICMHTCKGVLTCIHSMPHTWLNLCMCKHTQAHGCALPQWSGSYAMQAPPHAFLVLPIQLRSPSTLKAAHTKSRFPFLVVYDCYSSETLFSKKIAYIQRPVL